MGNKKLFAGILISFLMTQTVIATPQFLLEENCSQSIELQQNKEIKQTNLGDEIVEYALQFEGNPYSWGGTSLTDGADCSGFVYRLFMDYEITLPRIADDQFHGEGKSIAYEEALPGDLFFYGWNSNYAEHTALYIGNGQIIHAKGAAYGIVTEDYDYWNFIGAKRYWED